jgi:hypothetical protein
MKKVLLIAVTIVAVIALGVAGVFCLGIFPAQILGLASNSAHGSYHVPSF